MQIEHVPRIKFLHGTLIVILAWPVSSPSLYPERGGAGGGEGGEGGKHGAEVFIYRGEG